MSTEANMLITKFITLGALEQRAYERLGVPTSLVYEYREIKEGKQINTDKQEITIEDLKREYNTNGILRARLSWSLATYLSLNTYYSDKNDDWSEEVLRYQVDKAFLERLKAQGFDVDYNLKPKSMGYGFIGFDTPFFNIFEGYPNTSRLKIDWWWQVLKRAIEQVTPEGQRINLTLKEKDTGERSNLTFKNRDHFLEFFTKDGVMTYMDAEGRLAFRFMHTIYGESRAEVKDHESQQSLALSGIHLTNIHIPQMPNII